MQYAGKATIKIDGDVLESSAGASLDIGGSTRSSVLSSKQVLGYAEMPKQAHLECEVFVKDKTHLEDWRQVTGATLIFETDTGNTWTMAHAWLVEPPVFTQAGEGSKTKLVFEGPPAEELTS